MGFAFGGISQAPKGAVVEDAAVALEEGADEAVKPVAEVVGVDKPEEQPKEEKPRGRGRRRARHPAGTEKAGEFIADDPATPENEAWEEG